MNSIRDFGRLLTCLAITALITFICVSPGSRATNGRNNFALDPPINYAAAANGAHATANFTQDNVVPGLHFQPSFAIDGVRHAGADGGNYWRDEHGLPATLIVEFAGPREISEIDVITMDTDHYTSGADPEAEVTTFSAQGATDFELREGATLQRIPGVAAVSGNNHVWRRFTFAPIRTSQISITIQHASDNIARIVELEAWGNPSGVSLPPIVILPPVQPRATPVLSNSVTGLVPPALPGVGTFRIRGVQSGLCLGWRREWAGRLAHLETGKCDELENSTFSVTVIHNSGWSPLVIVPHPQMRGRTLFTIRSTSFYGAANIDTNNSTYLLSCATTARNVSAGPRSVDILPCDLNTAHPREDQTGGVDQLFSFSAAGPADRAADQIFTINEFGVGPTTDVWSVREGNTNLNAEIVMWEHGERFGSPDQLFRFEPVRSEMLLGEATYILSLGYISGPDGYWLPTHVANWDIPGEDGGPGIPQSNFDTENDNGVACARACVQNASCSAYTWVRPATSQGANPRCWLKGRIPNQAVGNLNVVSGVVRRNFVPQRH